MTLVTMAPWSLSLLQCRAVCAQLLAAAWAALMSCLMQSAYRRNRFQIALNDKVDRQKSQAAHREPDAFAAYLLHAVGLLVFRRG